MRCQEQGAEHSDTIAVAGAPEDVGRGIDRSVIETLITSKGSNNRD